MIARGYMRRQAFGACPRRKIGMVLRGDRAVKRLLLWMVALLLVSGRGSGCGLAPFLWRGRDGRSELSYAVYRGRYERAGDGWKFGAGGGRG